MGFAIQSFFYSTSSIVISTPLLVYLVLGPLAWVLMFIGTFLGRYRTGRLAKWKAVALQPPPHVTILVPAKDEGTGIAGCIEKIFAQDYANFDVIAIDDRSTDETGKILDNVAAKNSRLRVIHIPQGGLPSGWLGKCHALFNGAKSADGEWLLFVDSDVTLAPNALSAALSLAITRKYDAISLFTRLECHGFLEELMLPPLGAAWVIMHAASKTNEDSRKESAVANGQFFLIRRSAYEKVGGHESVKDQITEDVELMRKLKGAEFKVRIFMGAHLAATRMHSNLKQMFSGWSRIYSGTPRRRPWKILWAMWFIISAILTVYPALLWGVYRAIGSHNFNWLEASAAHFVLMTLYLMLIYHWSGNRSRFAFLIPISSSVMLAIFVYSLRKCQTGKIVWRDTVFAPESM